MTFLCNWDMAALEDPESPCGKTAVAIYSQLNPRRRQPDEPRYLLYPACKSHDSPRRQKAAEEAGFKREVL